MPISSLTSPIIAVPASHLLRDGRRKNPNDSEKVSPACHPEGRSITDHDGRTARPWRFVSSGDRITSTRPRLLQRPRFTPLLVARGLAADSLRIPKSSREACARLQDEIGRQRNDGAGRRMQQLGNCRYGLGPAEVIRSTIQTVQRTLPRKLDASLDEACASRDEPRTGNRNRERGSF